MASRAIEISRKLRAFFNLQLRTLTFGKWDMQKYFADETAALSFPERGVQASPSREYQSIDRHGPRLDYSR